MAVETKNYKINSISFSCERLKKPDGSIIVFEKEKQIIKASELFEQNNIQDAWLILQKSGFINENINSWIKRAEQSQNQVAVDILVPCGSSVQNLFKLLNSIEQNTSSKIDLSIHLLANFDSKQQQTIQNKLKEKSHIQYHDFFSNPPSMKIGKGPDQLSNIKLLKEGLAFCNGEYIINLNENHRIDVANWILNILKEMDEQNASFACFSEAYFCPKNKKSYQGFLKTGKILHLRHFIAHRQTFLKLRAFQESLLQDYYGFMLSSKIMQARQNCVFSKISLCSSIKQILKPHDWDQYWYLMVQHNLFNRIQERPKFLANNKQFSYLMDADGGIFMISEKEKTVSQRESSIAQVSNSRL